MNSLLLINIIFSAFFLLYIFLLKKLTFFQINRLYLIGCLLFSLLVPFIGVEVIPQQEQISALVLLPEPVLKANITGSHYSINELLFTVYLFGILISSIGFLSALIKIWRLRNSSSKQLLMGCPYFLAEGSHAFSFFRSIYIGKELEAHTRELILQHELVHLKQLHSLDTVLYAFARVLFWFNPFIHWAGREVQLNHEFMADEAVNQKYGRAYQYCLMNESLNTKIFPLTN